MKRPLSSDLEGMTTKRVQIATHSDFAAVANPVDSLSTKNTAQQQTDHGHMIAAEYPTATKDEDKNSYKDATDTTPRQTSESSVTKLQNAIEFPPWGELELNESTPYAKTDEIKSMVKSLVYWRN
ncbi:hypothetical protein PGTUg99_034951 [Puccinia graminis f. sp. tritici]|uniref:Uncharacterized protein n=1 Tax=Puccinia graminis f. sp. tritici TaxID=56615 RepID=A0A5B0RM47_PUCGR|nr:hypothetical protein PGTUg99_034951 [Puccinia graminis f. sp. tritici]